MGKNEKIALIVLGSVVGFFIIFQMIVGVLTGWRGWGMMGPGMMGMYGIAGWPWGWIIAVGMIIFWGLVIAGAVFMIRAIARGSGGDSSTQHHSALEILKRRYASGEISKQEFEDKKKDLLQN